MSTVATIRALREPSAQAPQPHIPRLSGSLIITQRKVILGFGRAEITLSGWPHVPEIQMQALKIFIGTVLRIAGRKSPVVTAERRPTGALFHATWRP